MKRLAIYGLLFPPTCLVLFLIPDGATWDWRTPFTEYLALVAFAYVVGILPALITGAADWLLTLRRTPVRWLWCTAIGGLLIPLAVQPLIVHHGYFQLIKSFGPVGAVASFCCWAVAKLWVEEKKVNALEKRLRAAATVAKTCEREDGKARVNFIRRDDGLFQFEEEHERIERGGPHDGEPYWLAVHKSGFYESLETAESEAANSVSWLKGMRSVIGSLG